MDAILGDESVTLRLPANSLNTVMNVDGSDNVIDTYIRGINLISSANNGYYLFNAHGDVTQLANAAGTITKDYHYDAFGVETSPDEADANPFRYCGEYFDQETGDIYLRARYYNPATGRFAAEDPLHDSLNWYTYCGGNPVSFIDPTGLVKVMLDYILEKNGGEYQVNREYDGWAVLRITMNGYAAIYSAEEVNGHYLVDNELLMASFRLTENQSLHLPQQDMFHSEVDAVLAFGLVYWPKSRSEEREYGASINKNIDGRFYFDHVLPARGSGLNDEDANEIELRGNSKTTVAFVHTHWHPEGLLTFSDADIKSLHPYLKAGYYFNSYLFNRNGELMITKPILDSRHLGMASAQKLFSIN